MTYHLQINLLVLFTVCFNMRNSTVGLDLLSEVLKN